MDPQASSLLLEAYQIARSGALVVPRPSPGVLMATGGTRLDLIQRISTNELSGIAEGEVRATILTTAIGRIVDRLHVLSLGSRLALMTSPGLSETVLAWLRAHVFFQDEIDLSQILPNGDHWFILGPEAVDWVSMAVLGKGEIRPGRGQAIPGGLIWPATPPEPEGLHLLLEPGADASSVPLQTGILPMLAEDVYQSLRVESGFPEFSKDFDREDIPLEVGLTHAVSFTKGCYLGQEIIARMESRARWPRRLLGARLPTAVPVPDDLTHEGRTFGRLTSLAYSPRLGWIGLAVVRSEAPRSSLTVDGVSLELLELPFPVA